MRVHWFARLVRRGRLVAAWLMMVIISVGVAGGGTAQTLRVAVEGTYPPFSEILPSGELVGFDIDIARALCREMEVECVLRPHAWEGLIPGLLGQRFDVIIASMSITPQRERIVAFSRPYYWTPGAFVGLKGRPLNPQADDLTGMRVGVQLATVSACYLDSHLGAVISIQRYDTQESANLDLVIGRLDLVFADWVTLVGGFLNRPAGENYELKGSPVYDPECMGKGIGIALRLEDSQLLSRINAALEAIRADGAYQRISQHYFSFDLYTLGRFDLNERAIPIPRP